MWSRISPTALTRVGLAVFTLGVTSSASAQNDATQRQPLRPIPLQLLWNNGLRIESEDRTIALRIRMRLENDWVFMESGSGLDMATGGLEDGTELRRVRLGIMGTVAENVDIKAQADFGDGEAEFRSVYANIAELPVINNLRIGNQREPFGLERQTGTHYVIMMERASANGLTPRRNTGFLIHDHVDERCTWQFGFFRETNDQGFGQGDDGIAATGRVTGILWEEDEQHFVHAGVSLSRREFGPNGVRFRARPSMRLVPRFVDTGAIAADHGEMYGGEFVWMYGPTSIQAEHFEARIGGVATGASQQFSGSFIELSHFLTPGDHRRFRRKYPRFVRVRPQHEDGAWELTARVSQIDLNSRQTRGGEMKDYTLGLNWYANANFRLMGNLVYAELENVGGALLLGFRFGFDF